YPFSPVLPRFEPKRPHCSETADGPGLVVLLLQQSTPCVAEQSHLVSKGGARLDRVALVPTNVGQPRATPFFASLPAPTQMLLPAVAPQLVLPEFQVESVPAS